MSASPALEKPSALAPEEQKKAVEEWKRGVGQIFLSSRDAITLVDSAGNILAWNPSAERLYGWKETEVLGKPFLDLVKAELPRPLAQIENIGADRVMLGADLPSNVPVEYAKYKALELAPEVYDKVLGGTAIDVFKLKW